MNEGYQRMRRLLMVGWMALVWAGGSMAQTESVSGPVLTIDHFHTALTDMAMRADELGYTGRFQRIRPAVEETFDLEFMALKSLGRDARSLSPDQRSEWIETFSDFVAANWARQFDGWSNYEFESQGVEDAPRETRIVKTRLVRPDDDDVKLHYRLREVARSDGEPGEETGSGEENTSGSSWRIIDVYSNGTVSELALRRSEFSSLFAREGFDSLMKTVRAKVDSE
ncbi:ABC transporter substrate-binding protein [Myxococcota bacterium]|nr:ABC transporter substrate-binding protein [Myxococcota bacterium]